MIDANSDEGRELRKLREEVNNLQEQVDILPDLIELAFGAKKIMDKAASIIKRAGLQEYNPSGVYHTDKIR